MLPHWGKDGGNDQVKANSRSKKNGLNGTYRNERWVYTPFHRGAKIGRIPTSRFRISAKIDLNFLINSLLLFFD